MSLRPEQQPDSSGCPQGPRASYGKPKSGHSREPIISGTTVELLVDSLTPQAEVYAGIITFEPGASGPLHWHDVGEFAYVLRGCGVLLDADGSETPVSPNGFIWHPAGHSGAHAMHNQGDEPLVILFVYPALDGRQPSFRHLDTPTEA